MSHLANGFHRLALTVGKMRGRRPKHIVDGNEVSVTFEKPKVEKDAIDDSAHFYIEGYANPVKVDYESSQLEHDMPESRYNLIPSQKYQTFMKTKVVKESFLAEGMKMNKILYAVVGAIVSNIVMGLIILVVIVV